METGDKKNIWKNTIQKAEVSPSVSVWKGVEMQLDKEEVLNLRKNVFFYKLLAAACIAFALLAFGISSWMVSSAGLQTTQQSTVEVVPNSTTSENEQQSSEAPILNRSEEKYISNKGIPFNGHNNTLLKSFLIAGSSDDNTHLRSSPIGKQSAKPQLIFDGKIEEDIEEHQTIDQEVSPVVKEESKTELLAIYSEPIVEGKKKENKKQSERFWTSVGFAAGSFNNTTPSSSSAPASMLQSSAAGQTAASESNSPGYSYAFNVGIGTKVSKRWLVQGGMSYISQLSDYTATTVVASGAPLTAGSGTFAAASINEFKKQEEDNTVSSILTSTPYTVNNNIQIISFPLQAGYVVFERKMALQINSGVSTDLFLQNTTTPNADNLEKTTQGRGDDSPYRPVNFSGLFGTEFSYKFGENYRVSVSPGLRYPFNSIYKNDLGIKSTPLTFDVALRFRYILK